MNLKNQIRLWHITVRWKQKGKYFNKDYIVTASSKDKAEEMARDRTMTPESMEDSKEASFRVRDLGPVTNNKAYYASDINVESLSSVHEESALNNTIISFAILWGQEIGWRITHDPDSEENRLAIAKLKDNPRMVELITSWAETFMKSKNTDSDEFFKERMKMYLNTDMTSDEARPVTDTEYKQILRQAEEEASLIRNKAQQEADEQLEKISEIAHVLQSVQDISAGTITTGSGQSIQKMSPPDISNPIDSSVTPPEPSQDNTESEETDSDIQDAGFNHMTEQFLRYQQEHKDTESILLENEETSTNDEEDIEVSDAPPTELTKEDEEIMQQVLAPDNSEDVPADASMPNNEATPSDTDDDMETIVFDFTEDHSTNANADSMQEESKEESEPEKPASDTTVGADDSSSFDGFPDDDTDSYDDNIIEEEIPEEEVINEDDFPPDEDDWEQFESDSDDEDEDSIITDEDYAHMNSSGSSVNRSPVVEQSKEPEPVEVSSVSYDSLSTGTLKDVLYQVKPEKLLPFLPKLDYIIENGKNQATLPADEWVDHVYHKNIPEKPEDYTKLIVDVLSECQPINGQSAVRYVYENLDSNINTSKVIK